MIDKSKSNAEVIQTLSQDSTTPQVPRERKPNPAWSADLMTRCAAFANALCKSAAGAQPGRKPFAVYLKRDTGKPNLPNRESAELAQRGAFLRLSNKSFRDGAMGSD